MFQLVGNATGDTQTLSASKLRLNLYGNFGSGQVAIQIQSKDKSQFVSYPELTFTENSIKVIDLPHGSTWRAVSSGGVVSVTVEGF